MNGSILVTGYGFIGKHLIEKLKQQSLDITVIDKSHMVISDKSLKVIPADLRYVKNLEFDYVFHLAGLANVSYQESNPLEAYEANVLSTVNLLREVKVRKKLLFTSSAAVYGTSDTRMIKEDEPLKPNSVYGETKVACENFIHMTALRHGLDYSIVRLFNTYGPQQSPMYIIPQFLKQLREDNKIVVRNGSAVRDFIFINDVVDALLTVIENDEKVVNVGTSYDAISMYELAQKVVSVFHSDAEIVDLKREDKSSPQRLVSNSAILRSLGWEPKYTLDQGLLLV